MAILGLLVGGAASIAAEQPAESLRLRHLFDLPPPPDDAEASDQEPIRDVPHWPTWDPQGPPVFIPPAEWFQNTHQEGDPAQAELEEILSRLLGDSETTVDLNVRGLGSPGAPSRVRRHERSPIGDLGRDFDGPQGHARLEIQNAYERLALELSFKPEEEGIEPITLILPPGISEQLTLPEGQYALHRKAWNPIGPTRIEIIEEFAPQHLRERRSYQLTLSTAEEARIGRDIERAKPTFLSINP